MAYLTTNEAFADLKKNVLSGIQDNFPLAGKKQTIELTGLEVKEDHLDSEDVSSQHQARLDGKSWAAPVFGHLVMKDNATGKVVDRQRVKLADVPKMTKRHSYIIEGGEVQVDNQWQLKPGVYTRRRANGQLETQFNSPKKSFDVTFDPAKKVFLMSRGKSSGIPVYPLMKELGVDDDTLKKQWGKDILEANQKQRAVGTAMERLFKADKKRAPESREEAREYFHQAMADTQFRPDSTEITIGKPLTTANGEMFSRVTRKMLDVQDGTVPEDQRDDLVFKDLRTAADYARDKLTNWQTKRALKGRVNRKINNATNIREVIRGGMFNDPVKWTFTQNSLAHTADQVNPLEMLEGAFQTTVMGPGGIQSERSISEEAKLISPSHLGFLDPIHTPEGSKTGVSLHLPVGVRKDGNTPKIPVYSTKTGKMESIDPAKFYGSKVVMPDQVRWEGGKPKPMANVVKISAKGNDIVDGSMGEADYVMRHPSQMFSTTSNLIPWLGNNSGNRTSYAATQMKQAISLKHREAPQVQVSTDNPRDQLSTFEGFVGFNSAHTAPVDGKVVKVTKDHIEVKPRLGKRRKVALYNNFPLNDPKSVLDSTPLVKVGDRVKQNQVVADNNFTRNGKLALGTNLRVGYLPFKGMNFEDGIVISEAAAKKMTSVHMHKPQIQIADTTITNPKSFRIHHPEAFTRQQMERVDENGVVKKGLVVQPGDPLVLATKPYEIRGRNTIGAVRKNLSTQQTNASLAWTSDHPGKVVGVHKDRKGNVTVHVRTEEQMQIGDKMTGRAGNKGIITAILPDQEMPATTDGRPIDVALNPAGIPGRMNMGQVFETVASKIADKTGKPYVVRNFEYGVDQLEKVQRELKKHGISDQEELVDPVTGQKLGKALVGNQHLFKLNFQIDKKVSARAGNVLEGSEPEHYDNNLIPSGGGKAGAQSLGNLALYAMLAHGAKANIREMQTWKSEGPDTRYGGKKWDSNHQKVWKAIQEGDRLPPPKKTYAFQKMEDMLRASGVNVDKKGNRIQLSPLTDDQVITMSAGEVKDPTAITYGKMDKTGEFAPIPGGLFDPRLTGGHGGRKWSHIKLAESMPNPVFEGPIQKVLGMGKKDYGALVNGEQAWKNGKLVELDTPGSVSGGEAIAGMLGKLDRDKELKRSEKELEQLKLPTSLEHRENTPKLDKAYKKVKYLRALQEANITPKEAYTVQNLPVLPPAMRPVSALPDGTMKTDDLNMMYKYVGEINEEMKKPNFKQYVPDSMKKEFRANMYDGMKALTGIGTSKWAAEHDTKGLLHQIAGTSPKRGYFQGTLLKRRQDMTMRGTITPDSTMGLDNVGLPEEKALTIFRPFVTRKLVEMGAAKTALDAQKLLSKKGKKDKLVYRALDNVMDDRPVLLKRDPVLHKHGIQSFKAHRVPGKSIQIHPLVTGGYGADFDGDTMAVYVPTGREAVNEAKKMMPSNNLYNVGSGAVEYRPSHESALGLFKMSRVTGDSKKSYKDPTQALQAARDGKVKVTDTIKVGKMTTTPGRLMLASALPDQMQKRVLEDRSFRFDRKGINEVYTQLADRHKGDFGDSAADLMRMGYDASFGAVKIQNPNTRGTAFSVEREGEDPKKNVQFLSMGTHSFGLDDFKPEKTIRDRNIRAAQKKIDAINRVPGISGKERERRTVDEWFNATDRMYKETVKKSEKDPSNFMMMHQAGVKPTRDNVQQLRLAPMLVVDSRNRIIPKPITKSYSEGLDTSSYWQQQSGARRGSVLKAQETSGPGAFTKQLMNTSMGLVVDSDDCGTARGVGIPVGSQDIYDRELANDLTIKGKTFKRGQAMTPDVVGFIRANDKKAKLEVRSTLKCEHGTGVCQRCAGRSPNGQYFGMGTNVGVLSTQSLGERSVQLTLKAFHSGGIAKRGPQMVNDFRRVTQLTELPRKIPDAARIATRAGVIEKIEKDPTGMNVFIGGQAHHVPKDRYGNPLWKQGPSPRRAWEPPRVGMRVDAGHPLSDPNRTNINPHELYKATRSMEKVQNHLTRELHGIYGPEGVRRQHVETVVKAMSNLTRVTDPGDMPGVLKGEYQATSALAAQNRRLKERGLRPVTHRPILKGIKAIPLEVQEDWMAKVNHERIRSSLAESASTGASSYIHGLHPIPGVAYGAEFGQTKKDVLTRPHLREVPEHYY